MSQDQAPPRRFALVEIQISGNKDSKNIPSVSPQMHGVEGVFGGIGRYLVDNSLAAGEEAAAQGGGVQREAFALKRLQPLRRFLA